MEKTARLHPLLTAAAVSVTVFSAVGVAAMTGLLPSSSGSAKQAVPAEQLAAAPAPTPREPVFELKPADMPPAAPKATPAPRPVKKVVMPPVEPLPVPAVAPTPSLEPAQGAEAPRPLPAGTLGTVEAVREVKTPAEKSNGVGPIAGGVGGAVLGSQLGKEFGGKGFRNVLTVLGAAGGAFAGKEIERNARATTHWEVDVRLDDGTRRTLSNEARPYWQPGHRVRLLDGALQPA